MTPAANFATRSAGVDDTSGKQWNNIRLLTTCSELEGKKLLTLLPKGVQKK
jgi:hypothetical protein